MEDLSRYLEQQHPRDLARARSGADHAVAPRFAESRGLVSHAAGGAAWEWDLKTGRIRRGGAVLAISGYGPEEIGADPDWWHHRIHPADRASVLAAFDSALSGERRELVLLYRFQRKDGSHTLLLDRAFVLNSEAGAPERIIGLVREVSDAVPAAFPEEPAEKPPEPKPPLRDDALLPKVAAEAAFDRLTDPSLALLPVDALLAEILGRLRFALQGDASLALWLSSDGLQLECLGASGIRKGKEPMFALSADSGVVGRVLASGAAILTDQPRRDGGVPSGWVSFCSSFAGVPMVVDGRVRGALCVVTGGRRSYSKRDQRLLEVAADRVGPAIERAGLLESARAERERLARLSATMAATIEEYRRRVSQELHDEIGQLLTALRLTLRSGESGRAMSEEILDDLFASVRDITTSLRPPMLDDLGLGPALTWHCDRFTRQTGVRVNLTTSGLERRYPPQVELAVFRVVQEALTNVARHSGVASARVVVRGERRFVDAMVVDTGIGFAPGTHASTLSSGLTGIRERILSVGGRCIVSSTPGSGTRVSLFVPIREGGSPPSIPHEVP